VSSDICTKSNWGMHNTSVVSSPVMILYDLSCNYRNYVLTLSYGNPEINLIVG